MLLGCCTKQFSTQQCRKSGLEGPSSQLVPIIAWGLVTTSCSACYRPPDSCWAGVQQRLIESACMLSNCCFRAVLICRDRSRVSLVHTIRWAAGLPA